MTQERAKHLWQNQTLGGGLRYAEPRFGGKAYADGMTRDEEAYVKKVWYTFPNNTSFMTALLHIAQGADK
jgi:hypothetical protein